MKLLSYFRRVRPRKIVVPRWLPGAAALFLVALCPQPQASHATRGDARPPRHAARPVRPATPGLSCAQLTRKLPNLSAALCDAAQLAPSGAQSVHGVPLVQRDVLAEAPAAEGEAGPANVRRRRVLVIGGIHGDERSSAALVFHWIGQALRTPDGMDWRFIPALNPDGLLAEQPTRVNARGVDLNRNFPTPNWAREATHYWVQRTKRDKRRYPGPAPLSEPESRFVVDTMASWKPDLIVSVHAPYGVLDYDGPNVPPQRLGRLYLDRVGIFPGSLGHYGGVHRGVPVVTIELPSANRTPTEAEMRQMWVDLLRWTSERLSFADASPAPATAAASAARPAGLN